jgi:HKD family nuclease
MKRRKKMDETIRIQREPRDFVMVSKSVLEDKDISLTAKAMYIYATGYYESGKFDDATLIKELYQYSNDTVHQIEQGLKELKENGYIR